MSSKWVIAFGMGNRFTDFRAKFKRLFFLWGMFIGFMIISEIVGNFFINMLSNITAFHRFSIVDFTIKFMVFVLLYIIYISFLSLVTIVFVPDIGRILEVMFGEKEDS